jgi:riboflavin-specific deaminase-like protein
MERPYIYSNMAMSADGKITSYARESSVMTTRTDRRAMDHLRATADAVMIGASTLRQDDPPLHVRDPAAIAVRKQTGATCQPRSIVVTGSGQISAQARIFRPRKTVADALSPALRPLIVTVESRRDAVQAALGEAAEVWGHGALQVEFPPLLLQLYKQGIRKLLVEGGGALMWSLVQHKLLDAVHVTIAPCLLGGQNAPTPVGGAGFTMAERLALSLTATEVVGDEIYCTYHVKK